MRWLKLVYLLLGSGLLGLVLATTDLEAVLGQVMRIGWAGIAVVLGIHLLAFATDVWGWQLTFVTVPASLRWFSRLFLVRMVGEAFNQVSLVGSIGAETIKAIILKDRYRVRYRESGVSLVLAKTLDLIALVVFLAGGFGLVLASDRLSATFKAVAGTGLAVFAVAVALFVLVQRLKLVSRLAPRLAESRLGGRLATLLRTAGDTDEMLAGFYGTRRGRFLSALGAAFLNWPLGVVEIWCLMWFLDRPISLGDAWIIDSMGQLVTAGTFFVPLGIGVQEGTFVVLCGAITGDPALGLAVSVVRRFRELVWFLAGLAIWWLLSLGQAAPDAASATAWEASDEPA